jgi:coenzyme F420 biosynthesis associated uncharacterized protein
MPTEPVAELLVVDRKAWIAGNLRTMQKLFEGVEITGGEARVLAYEGGALIGVLARAVLAQFDPFRDQLLVVHPNLGDMESPDGLRFLVLHEVTHLAQFRAAPWIADQIVDLARSVLTTPGLTKEMAVRARERLPEIARWAREALEGRSGDMPIFELLPPEQRASVQKLHALVTLLEGHATHMTDVIGKRVLDDYAGLQERIEVRKRRPPLMRLVEAMMGLEMKRQQYVLGHSFCRAVWDRGGAEALAPAWTGPAGVPTTDELRDPESWLKRVA